MDKKEYEQMSTKLTEYNRLDTQIKQIKDLIQHQQKHIESSPEQTSICITSYYGNGSNIASINFKPDHHISQQIMNMLQDEIVRLEKQRDQL